jgi:hypothetical protein
LDVVMHPIEAVIAEHRANAKPLGLETVGGLEAITANADRLRTSSFAADLVLLLVDGGAIAGATGPTPAGAFITSCYASASDPLTLLELGDHLPAIASASESVAAAVFLALLTRFESDGPGELRRAALRAVLGLALGQRSRELRLAAVLLDVAPEAVDADAVAKAMGLVWSRVREQGLVQRLGDLARSGCAEAHHELGSLKLVQVLEGAPSGNVSPELADARAHFQSACQMREVAPESHLMRLSIEALQSLTSRQQPAAMDTISAVVSRHAFALQSASQPQAPLGWQSAQRELVVSWARVALTMDALAKRLWEPSWWQPAAVIGHELLRVYAASRSFFRNAAPLGLEAVVRPVIAESIFNSAARLHLVREWLRKNPDDPQVPDASTLLADVEKLGATVLPVITQAKPASDSGSARSGAELIPRLLSSLSSALEASLPDSLAVTLQDWLERIEAHPDLRSDPGARQFVGQVVYFLLQFLHACTNRASPSDPLSGYLFERSLKDLPHENVLQHHFLGLLSGWMGQMGYEVRGVSSGRCDVVFSRDAERLVVEVKRELKDASVPSLFAAYGAQTEEYQNSSWRLGILLVLDLTREDGTGLHMTDAVACRALRRNGESADRIVFLTRIAGRRLPPSGLTRAASVTRAAD